MDEELVDRHWKALEELRKSAEMYDDPVIDQRIMELTLTSKMILESEENEPEERVR